MTEGNCVGLHPYGSCAPGQGCNAPPEADLRAELAAARAEIERAERVRLQLWDKLDAARARIAALEAERDAAVRRAEAAERMVAALSEPRYDPSRLTFARSEG